MNQTTQEILQSFCKSRQIEGELKSSLDSLNPTDAEALSVLIEQLSPSANTVRDYLLMAQDISKRDSVNISHILKQSDIEDILSAKLARKEKQGRIRKILKNKRFPETTRIRNKLEELIVEIRKEVGLTVMLPKDLEGGNISLNISAESQKDLKELSNKLAQLSQNERCKTLLNILHGTRYA